MNVSMPKLKILCLHGHRQNGYILQKKTKQLRKKLSHLAELEYISSSLPVVDPELNCVNDANDLPGEIAETTEEVERTWWYWRRHEREAVARTRDLEVAEFVHLEESLTNVASFWNTQGEFDGILAFSQGSTLASILIHCSLSETNNHNVQLIPPPRFAIFVSGFMTPCPSNLLDYPISGNETYDIPSLHIYGVADQLVDPARSLAMASKYQDHKILAHDGGHGIPQRVEHIPVYLEFVEEMAEALNRSEQIA